MNASVIFTVKFKIMGKGDVKTKRGKITKGSFGKLRRHKADKEKTQEEPKKTPPDKK